MPVLQEILREDISALEHSYVLKRSYNGKKLAKVRPSANCASAVPLIDGLDY